MLICLPDYDLDCSTEQLSNFFELFHKYNFRFSTAIIGYK